MPSSELTVLEFTGERVIPGLVDPDLFNEHLARYRFAARFAPARRVLDAGCGTGYGPPNSPTPQRGRDGYLARKPLHYAPRITRGPASTSLQGACESLPLPLRSFDLVAGLRGHRASGTLAATCCRKPGACCDPAGSSARLHAQQNLLRRVARGGRTQPVSRARIRIRRVPTRLSRLSSRTFISGRRTTPRRSLSCRAAASAGSTWMRRRCRARAMRISSSPPAASAADRRTRASPGCRHQAMLLREREHHIALLEAEARAARTTGSELQKRQRGPPEARTTARRQAGTRASKRWAARLERGNDAAGRAHRGTANWSSREYAGYRSRGPAGSRGSWSLDSSSIMRSRNPSGPCETEQRSARNSTPS